MQKIFYVARSTDNGGTAAQDFDRFKRVEQLNELLALGWRIVELVNEDNDSYFILENE